MTSDPPPSKITLFDTTLRDGELMPGVKMTIAAAKSNSLQLTRIPVSFF